MPSDSLPRAGRGERALAAVAATADARERFRAGILAAAEQIDAHLAGHRRCGGDGSAIAAAELGAFARGRIDAATFAALFDDARTLGAEPAAVMERAAAVLRALHAAGDAPFVVDVSPGEDVGGLARRALAELGRAFGAAMVYRAATAGEYRADEHGPLLDAFPFARWNASERELAPPLVIEVDDADLHADALAELLDGQVKLVIVSRGETPGAPLARLVTPDVLVMQTASAADLARAASFDGPAVAALVPESAARFVHDPDAGETLGERLTVHALPAAVPRARCGGRSAWQLREEIAQLLVLGDARLGVSHAKNAEDAENYPGGPSSRAQRGTRSPRETEAPTVDSLTRWLLEEAGL
jgi:hypothetical protein